MKTQRRVRSVVLVLAALSFAAGAAGQTAPAAPGLLAPDPPADSPRVRELAKTASAVFDAFIDGDAAFTRDGKRVLFVSNRDGLPQLYVSDAARPDSAVTRLVSSTERVSGPLALADGKRVLFRSDTGADENWSIFVGPLDGGGAAAELTAGTKRQRDAPIVPDGAPNTAFYSARTMSASGSEAYSLELTPGAAEKKLYGD